MTEASLSRFSGSMLGRWRRMYSGKNIGTPRAYDDSPTYQAGADWLAGCATVQDWGCGRGWARRFFTPEQYEGVDGTASPHADVVADLREYRSDVDGIFMRHVLEHNVDWQLVLDNALASARQRMALIFFTPFAAQTTALRTTGSWAGVPDLSLPRAVITDRIHGAGGVVGWEDLESPKTQYGFESIARIEWP